MELTFIKETVQEKNKIERQLGDKMRGEKRSEEGRPEEERKGETNNLWNTRQRDKHLSQVTQT